MHLNVFIVHLCGKYFLAWEQPGVEPLAPEARIMPLDHCPCGKRWSFYAGMFFENHVFCSWFCAVFTSGF